ncbi:MAG: YHS domain-containing protein [Candidatus Eremiobacteraeota bacterium]|nr:YHS domain-containing protein [Candidatus Eremiobacteraeota bacterium]MCW5865786.1 YHS domain-containing protein [Candidatus Eremiobacteraeota bacterium]
MNHIGLNGLDPVAFLGHLKKQMGSPKFKKRYGAKTYFFSSQRNLEIFEINPERFLPQLEGMCPVAYALGGKRHPGNPDFCNVVGDKLYCYSKPVYRTLGRVFPWLLNRASQRYHYISAEEVVEAGELTSESVRPG